MSNFYDPWTHAIQIFLTRLLQFVVASLLVGILVWSVLLRWYFDVPFMEASKLAMLGNNAGLRAMLILCLGNGALLTGWLFTWLVMRWPARHARGDRHHRGAQIIYRDDE